MESTSTLRIWYAKNFIQWIYSPCEKLGRQRLAPLHPMWRPLVPYLYGAPQMVSCYDFELKLEIRDMDIIEKILKKIWEKDKEKLSGKSCKKGGEIFNKCCLCALWFGFFICWSQKLNLKLWDIWRVSSWCDLGGKLGGDWILVWSYHEFEAGSILEMTRLRWHTG